MGRSDLMVQDTIKQIIETVARDLGYGIYEYSILLRGVNTRILVKIDKHEGIAHQDCELFSRELSRSMDEHEVLPNYSLEISSPGINRKIRNLEEFKRFIGAPAKVIYNEKDTRTHFKGIIEGVEDGSVCLVSNNKEVIISFNDIISTNLDY